MGCYFYFSVCCLWFVHAVCNENLTSGAWEVWCSKITPNWAWRKIWRDIIKGYPPIQNLQSSLYTSTYASLMLCYNAFPGSQDNCNAQPGFHLWWMYYARTWVFQSGIGSSKASCIKSQALPGAMHRYSDLVARCTHCMKVHCDMLIIYNDWWWEIVYSCMKVHRNGFKLKFLLCSFRQSVLFWSLYDIIFIPWRDGFGPRASRAMAQNPSLIFHGPSRFFMKWPSCVAEQHNNEGPKQPFVAPRSPSRSTRRPCSCQNQQSPGQKFNVQKGARRYLGGDQPPRA